jgi:hypothetical protein
MTLLEAIIDAAIDDKVPIGTLLRKCLVLEQQVKNEKFRAWLNKELDGYDREDELPSYRNFRAVSYGLFLGPGGSQLADQPLSLSVLDDDDLKLVEMCPLIQPASSYEARPSKADNATHPWNPALTTKYQRKFFGGFVLNRAWQLVPSSVLVGLLETVRNRVLRFALELKDQLGPATPTVEELPREIIEKSVVTNIFGGNILIAAHAENVSQMAQIHVAVGDLDALKNALKNLGVTDEGIKKLETDIEADKQNGKPAMGEKIKGWLSNIGSYLSQEGAKAGVDVAKKLATRWLLQHYGIDIL